MSSHSAFATPRAIALKEARARFERVKLQEDVIAIVRASVRTALGADGITFVLREGEHCHYVEEDGIGPLWKGQRFPIDDCISGWVMLNNQTAAIPDIFADARVPHDVYRQTGVKSLMMTPVRIGPVVAAIGAYWKTPRDFTADDIQAIEMMADFAGKALRQARG
jgi:GAF domain-containing protein